MQNDLPNQTNSTSPVVQPDSTDLSDAMFNIGKASKYLGVSIDTLRRWEAKGKIVSHRSPGGHRYFLKEELDKVFDTKYSRNRPPLSVQGIQTTPTAATPTSPVSSSPSTPVESVQAAPTAQVVEPTTSSTPTTNSAPSFRPAVVEEPSVTQPAPVITPAAEPLRPTVEIPAVQTAPTPPVSSSVFYPPEPVSFVNQSQPAPVTVQPSQPSFSTTPVPAPTEVVQAPPIVTAPAPIVEQPPVLTPVAPISSMNSTVSSPVLPPIKPQADKLALVRKISLVAIVLFVLVDIILVFIWYQGSVAVPIP